jgi:hypothetical protein
MDSLERVVAYLNANLDGVRVVQDAPPNTKKLGTYVTVGRTGGQSTMFLDLPRFTIDCHSNTGANSYALAERVGALMLSMPDADEMVSDVSISSFYRDDWADGYPCYSLHVHMVVNI